MIAGEIQIRGYFEARRDLDRTVREIMDASKPFRAFFSWWARLRGEAWSAVKASGGTFMGRRWPAMKAQYTRRTDGVTVPAWGGVPRIRAGSRKRTIAPKRGIGWGESMTSVRGVVSGRLRPSGRRVKQTSIMMQDTGSMRNAILAAPVHVGRDRLVIGPRRGGIGSEYAAHQDEMRPVVFWAGGDEPQCHRMIDAYADGLIAGFNRG